MEISYQSLQIKIQIEHELQMLSTLTAEYKDLNMSEAGTNSNG